MKRFLIAIPTLLIAGFASLTPASLTINNGLELVANVATAKVAPVDTPTPTPAIEQSVNCKSGDNGTTTDPAAFCATFGSTVNPDVSKGLYYKCVKGGAFQGKDATAACKAHGGVATGYLCAGDAGATPHYGADAATACKGVGGVYVAPAGGPCGANAIEVSIPIFTKDGHCVPNDPATGGAIVWYAKKLIALASGAVGSIILLMLLIAGIQYMTASGDPAKVKLAKTRITNSIIALALFLMAFAILSFLIPGGVFS